MKKAFQLIIISVAFISCNKTANENSESLSIPDNIIDIPFYSIANLSFDKNTLVMDLIDSTEFNNPTVFVQALNWYSFQISNTTIEFDSLRINHTMPVRDSIPIVNSNQINKDYLNQVHENLDNTLFGDFQNELFVLNWKTRGNYKEQQTSIIDRVNSLFARNIDTSNYKTSFPTMDTWFGTDCFPVFETYFLECQEDEKSIGHEIVGEINKSTKYFNEGDKLRLTSLIYSYSEKFKKYKTAPNKK